MKTITQADDDDWETDPDFVVRTVKIVCSLIKVVKKYRNSDQDSTVLCRFNY